MLDHYEAETLASVLPDGGRPWPPLMTVKAAVGHMLGGCALVETVASLLALERREIPAAARCDRPDPSLPLGPAPDGPLPENWTLLKCTNGFAGQNSAIVLGAP